MEGRKDKENWKMYEERRRLGKERKEKTGKKKERAGMAMKERCEREG